ncbi:hypothetical protein OG698_05950 [Streptomyces sp. NBC_01003]|uniref:hypothetical protein n=1 Tax=Streptomyces sp. NBC_01003 TaxID=2903714 RepID=UPI00386C49E8|nr:hypothetical protein OG698_05950 [Streptomyces sp. NBC_01003]
MRVELPPEPAHFVDRDEQRGRVLQAVEEWRGRSRPLVVTLSGPGGVGKTEPAHLVARVLHERFPEGVLSVDLDDFRLSGIVDTGDVLAQPLESLGTDPTLLAAQFKARCKRSRSWTGQDYWTCARRWAPGTAACGCSARFAHMPCDGRAGMRRHLALDDLDRAKRAFVAEARRTLDTL